MNYADDPEWAHKQFYSPEKRAAYEAQVAADRSARDRHQTEMRAAAFAAGAVSTAYLVSTAPQRRRNRARAWFQKTHPAPADYALHLADLDKAGNNLRIGSKQLDVLLRDYDEVLQYAVDLKQLG